jgi:hypothetical protein
VLNAFRHLSGGHLLSFAFYLLPFPLRVLIAFRLHSGGHLLPFAFQGVASVRNPKSKIENPKSCVGPSAIRTGSRTRPSGRGSNARFGPVEDRRNNRRFAAFTCTLCVLQIWWLSPFTFHGRSRQGRQQRDERECRLEGSFQPIISREQLAPLPFGEDHIQAVVDADPSL